MRFSTDINNVCLAAYVTNTTTLPPCLFRIDARQRASWQRGVWKYSR